MKISFQNSIDGTEPSKIIQYDLMSVADIRALAQDYQEENNVKLSRLEQSILFGIIPKPAITGSRSSSVDWSLPGHGKTSRFDNTFYRKRITTHVTACPTCGKVTTYAQHCDKISCPECWLRAINELSRSGTDKLISARNLYHPNHLRDRSLHHLVVSVPKHRWNDIYTQDGYESLRKYANKIAKEIGLLGSISIFHPFRRNGVDDDLVTENYKPDDENNLDDMEWRLGPHFHIIGYGFIDQNSKEWMDRHDGWFFSSLRTGKKRITTKKQLFTLVRYVLSHAGIGSREDMKDYQTITYNGELNSRMTVKVATLEAFREKRCQTCNDVCRHLELDFKNDTVIDTGESRDIQKFDIYERKDGRDITHFHVQQHINQPLILLESFKDLISCPLDNNTIRAMRSDGWRFRIIPNFKMKKEYRRILKDSFPI